MRAQSESQFFALSGVGHDKKFRSSLFKGLQVQGGVLVARRNGRNLPSPKSAQDREGPYTAVYGPVGRPLQGSSFEKGPLDAGLFQ